MTKEPSEVQSPGVQIGRPRHGSRITAALFRAAQRAHLIAHQTGTRVVVRRDGKVVEIEPDPDMYGELLSNTIRE